MPIKAPKNLLKNLRFRRELWTLGASSQSAREEIWTACSRDVVFFSDAFLFNFDPQNFPDQPERPTVLWPHQEMAIRRVANSVGKHSLIFPKTRRMGVTTLVMAAFFWRWMFRPKQAFLLLSAKEDRVDKKGDPSSLMYKLDHMLGRLPPWMRPPVDRANLRFPNMENGSVINGESTNADAGRGGVQTAVMMDEVAAMPNAESVIDAVAPMTESIYMISTPQGAYGAFHAKYTDWLAKKPEWVVTLHWTMHQEFAKGLYFTDEPVTGFSDASWNGKKARSPWYDKECLKLTGPKRIAQELDIAFNEAGGAYFEPELIERLLRDARGPNVCGEIEYDYNEVEPKWVERKGGKLALWVPVSANGHPPRGTYGVGCDIASGKAGTMSSQSTLSVVDLDTGRKVGEYKNNAIAPERFARQAVAVSKWFHDAKLIWGRQGPGASFEVEVTRHCKYFKIFRTKDDKIGYPETSGDNRNAMFGGYREALHNGRFKNPSVDAIKELRQFIYAPDGSIQHSAAIQKDVDPENKGKLHGDMVIADSLANMLLPVELVDTPKPQPLTYPENSAGARLQKYLREQQEMEYV